MPATRVSGQLVNGRVLRMICRIEKVPFGRGHMQVMTLQCGHKVEHLQRNDLKVGSCTGCPECR